MKIARNFVNRDFFKASSMNLHRNGQILQNKKIQWEVEKSIVKRKLLYLQMSSKLIFRTAIKKAIDHRERNFKCRSNNLIPAKVFKVKCCEKLSINEQDEKETIKVLCSSIGNYFLIKKIIKNWNTVKFYEFTDENCAQKTWIFRLKRFCDRLTA